METLTEPARDDMYFEKKPFSLTEPSKNIIDELIDLTREEIKDFYKEDDMRTHYIIFLNFTQVCKKVQILEEKGQIKIVDENGVEKAITSRDTEENGAGLDYIIMHFPERMKVGMFYASLDYFHPEETQKWEDMSLDELDTEKKKLMNKEGLWNLVNS